MKASSKMLDLNNVLVLPCKGESLSRLEVLRLDSAGHVLTLGQGSHMKRKGFIWLQDVPWSKEVGDPLEAVVTDWGLIDEVLLQG